MNKRLTKNDDTQVKGKNFVHIELPLPTQNYHVYFLLFQVISDAETGSSGSSNENDLPPKYEDVAEIPPKYDEATMKPNKR